MSDYKLNRTYKDSLFRMLFSDKHELLGLYNAIAGRDYDNPDEIEFNTLQDVIYISVKNDLSFVIRDYQPLYEHQSTYNGNMPLRNLLYISNIYSKMTVNQNLYGSTKIKLPTPQFIVFYNGLQQMPERSIQKLSDAYVHNNGPDDIQLELTVLILNINEGYNKKLMDNCKTLSEYTRFVTTVRRYSKEYDIETATEMAIEECITNNVLAEFLRNHKAEVKTVSILEYDAEKHMAFIREEGKVEGIASLVMKKVQKSKSLEVIAEELECTPEEIRYLYEAVVQCGAGCSVADVLDKIAKSS